MYYGTICWVLYGSNPYGISERFLYFLIMNEFREYYSRENIIKYLCKIRIAYANKRHKKYLLDNLVDKKNHLKIISDAYDTQIISELNCLLPSRRLWLTNGFNTYKSVCDVKSKSIYLKKIDTDEKNKQILYNTIKRHAKSKITYSYQVKLNNFISQIQNEIENCNYKINDPDIVPEIKEVNKSKKKYLIRNGIKLECRPISRFLLKDRIVISIANKFFTDLFDEFFEDTSLAFRAKCRFNNEEKNHHLAVLKILEYKQKNSYNNTFVAECDLKKFYDTVNHKTCSKAFYDLIEKSTRIHPTLDLKCAIHLFNEYLNCYDFKCNVEVLNSDSLYWSNQKDPNQTPINGKYPWIEKEIKENQYYKINQTDKIGVPQGGALSGLIANIILDYSDKQLKDIPNLFYVRYCDDMILMHENENTCKSAIDIYKKSIEHLLLFSHPFETIFFSKNKNFYKKINVIPNIITKTHNKYSIFKNINNKIDNLIKKLFPKFRIRNKSINSVQYNLSFSRSIKKFWNCKSKGPYQWGKLDISNNIYPWIGFVGYEIDYNCNTRIRKRSIKKEIDKQKKIITSIIKRIIKDNYKYKIARNNSIYRSAFEKLNGMSVGRINMYDYKTCENKICWADGFRCLTFNKFSKVQLRILDRQKNKCLNILIRNLGAETVKSVPEDDTKEIYKMGKAFSYYYQAGQKKNEA